MTSNMFLVVFYITTAGSVYSCDKAKCLFIFIPILKNILICNLLRAREKLERT